MKIISRLGEIEKTIEITPGEIQDLAYRARAEPSMNNGLGDKILRFLESVFEKI